MASSSNKFFEFEKILRHKEGSAGTLYYVKWKGYSDEYNSWEPQDNFVPKDVEDYMEQLKVNLIKRTEKAEKQWIDRKKAENTKLKQLAEQAKSRKLRKLRRDFIKNEAFARK